MRIRTIKPEFWTHPVIAKQSDATKLLAIGLLNLADDEGFFYADPKMVRNALRPMDDDSGITTVSLRDLERIGYISIRKHETHGDIGKVVSFADHQVINKPKASKIKGLYEYGIDTVAIPDASGLEGKGTGNREQGKEGIPPNPPKGGKCTKFVVPTIEEVDEYAATLDPPFTRTLQWLAHYESNGWKVGKNPMKDWKAAVRTWHASDKELHTPYTPPLKKLPWE